VKMADFKIYLLNHMHTIKKLKVNCDTPRQYQNFNWTYVAILLRSASRDFQS